MAFLFLFFFPPDVCGWVWELNQRNDPRQRRMKQKKKKGVSMKKQRSHRKLTSARRLWFDLFTDSLSCVALATGSLKWSSQSWAMGTVGKLGRDSLETRRWIGCWTIALTLAVFVHRRVLLISVKTDGTERSYWKNRDNILLQSLSLFSHLRLRSIKSPDINMKIWPEFHSTPETVRQSEKAWFLLDANSIPSTHGSQHTRGIIQIWWLKHQILSYSNI